MKTKGFTLIELLVVIVIIGILVAIALPNFIKIKDKAKEAEVKQQLHAIQLAIERYATDEDGNYPYFLYGGTAKFNLGTASSVSGAPSNSRSTWWRGNSRITPPFDVFSLPNDDWDYSQVTWNDLTSNDDLNAAFGDSLAYEGYLPKYPKNPFLIGDARIIYAVEWMRSSRNYFGGWGGFDGTHVGNYGWWSEFPELFFLVPASEEDALQTEHPGQFYYHARFSDGVTNMGHNYYQAQYNGNSLFVPDSGQDDMDEVNSLDVAAYDLSSWGSPRTKGMDIDTSILYNYLGVDIHAWRTGYFTLGQERNPYVGPDGDEGDYGNLGTPVDNFDERPMSDSVPDFFIIHLTSGLDTKRDDLGNL